MKENLSSNRSNLRGRPNRRRGKKIKGGGGHRERTNREEQALKRIRELIYGLNRGGKGYLKAVNQGGKGPRRKGRGGSLKPITVSLQRPA